MWLRWSRIRNSQPTLQIFMKNLVIIILTLGALVSVVQPQEVKQKINTDAVSSPENMTRVNVQRVQSRYRGIANIIFWQSVYRGNAN